jgi:FAD:protein FMN transferase
VTLTELSFPAMGSQVRLLAAPGAPLGAARELIEDLEARLTRFDPESELSRLNRDRREAVPASAPLRAAVAAALDGAWTTGGLADPTLLGAVVRAGYARSLAGHPRADVRAALAAAPSIRAGAPAADAGWRRMRVDDAAGTIVRPPAVALDLGGSAKGFAADRAAALLSSHGPCAADVGGDLRVTGVHAVQVLHPLTGAVARTLQVDGAVATSGIDKRLWWDAGGRPSHHLLDPATGTPAWTGVLTATARAPRAALAEALAKAAVLAGPDRGRAILGRYGGVLVTFAGDVLDAVPAARPAGGSATETTRGPAPGRLWSRSVPA